MTHYSDTCPTFENDTQFRTTDDYSEVFTLEEFSNLTFMYSESDGSAYYGTKEFVSRIPYKYNELTPIHPEWATHIHFYSK